MADSLRIQVTADSSAEANRLTGELQQWLKSRVDDSDIKVSRAQANAAAQDMGTVLVAVLAAPAIVELAKGPILELSKGLADWLRKSRATITITNGVTIENVKPDDVQAIVSNAYAAKKN